MFQRTKTRIGRLVVAPALGATMLLASSMQPAAAAVQLSNGATASTYVSCDASMGRFSITVDIRPESRFSSQSVAVRFYTKPLNGAWSDPGQWFNFRAPVRQRFDFDPPNVAPITFTVWAEYAWYDGQKWTLRGEEIKTYTQSSTYGNFTSALSCTV